MDRDVLVVGEALVDVVRRADGSLAEHAGGSAANVAVALARLGRPVRFATAIADDRYGGIVAAYIGRDGVRLASDPEVIGRTATAQATLAADGSASYEFDLEWRLGDVPDEPRPLVVHACSIGAVLQPGAAQVLDLLARMRPHATVTYDVNARPAITGVGADLRASVEAVVALADVVKASDEDLHALHPDADPVTAAQRLLELGPSAVIVTRGAEGATWVAGDGTVDVPAPQTVVVDTIAAGDTFGAALVDGLWTRGLLGAEARPALAQVSDVDRAALLRHATRAAALVVARPGADPPYRNELG